ncbi:tRNA N6-adenosine threonylcarbamoyltransferase [Apiospora hydei]|uniref:tRNA N6-adenosine threonylcarbamoyltransferase n=1 Tax=Apiospora hydei TaxID=1337664 RepID=A0ABR1WYJ4_9PEZI
MSAGWLRLRPHVAGRSVVAHHRLLARCINSIASVDTGSRGAAHRPRRSLLTLAIESSCDDTCVAILEKCPSTGAAKLRFNKKVTSDNREFQGVHPTVAVLSHTASLAPLIDEALGHLPEAAAEAEEKDSPGLQTRWQQLCSVRGSVRRKPDFVAVTRGPGMTSNLATGLNTAKGLATAWGVPLLGVNHMQAHALTPRLVSALARWPAAAAAAESGHQQKDNDEPAFPYLSLLVSGGHTLLVHSRSLCEHEILASASNIAIGDMLDKCARLILPASELSGTSNVMYGALLERFVFPPLIGEDGSSKVDSYDYEYTPPARRADEIVTFDSGLGWTLTPLLAGTTAMTYNFSGFSSQVQRIVEDRPDMPLDERRLLGRHAMRLAFEHLASRLLFALKKDSSSSEADLGTMKDVKTVVVAGGVASNRYLMHVLRSMLPVRGFGHLEINAPPPALCTDNAAMIAWTGMEMFEAGYRSQLDILAMRKWPVDPEAEGGGILGASGWVKDNSP